ncbi:hypothetical protein LUZ61_003362 [Rhynchospora tenuis]|uniref:DDE Tnp4 domain-containing protein n=1 Tax=Rhynchospora tenuis TaxID=198213 RepID=A0AAD6ESM3_9POAL|nr:hypothetical protein LUZ61_003362 [Rhynchospora tenuis]
MLGGSYFHQPDGSQVPVQVSSKRKYFPYFKDCLGAIDGTHIRAKVSPLDAPRYRGRKEYPTQNVLAACTFDLKFTATRYHLKEYSRNPPRNSRELYNLRHSSLRNAIERAFGVLKKRFPIIGSSNQSYYSVEVQKKIIMACCVLHNYLIDKDPDRRLMAQVDAEVANRSDEQRDTNVAEDSEERTRGEQLRDEIAASMWRNYNNNQV